MRRAVSRRSRRTVLVSRRITPCWRNGDRITREVSAWARCSGTKWPESVKARPSRTPNKRPQRLRSERKGGAEDSCAVGKSPLRRGFRCLRISRVFVILASRCICPEPYRRACPERSRRAGLPKRQRGVAVNHVAFGLRGFESLTQHEFFPRAARAAEKFSVPRNVVTRGTSKRDAAAELSCPERPKEGPSEREGRAAPRVRTG